MTQQYRNRILEYLKTVVGDKSIKEIAQGAEINRNTASTYVRVLQAENKLELKRKVGKAQMYQLSSQTKEEVTDESSKEPVLPLGHGPIIGMTPERFPELEQYKKAKHERDKLKNELERSRKEFEQKDNAFGKFEFLVLQDFDDPDAKSALEGHCSKGYKGNCSHLSESWLEDKLARGYIRIINPSISNEK